MLGRLGGQPRTARTFISLRTLEIASHLGVVHTFESSADVNPTLPFHMLDSCLIMVTGPPSPARQQQT